MIPIAKLRRAAMQCTEPYEMLGVLCDQLSEAKTRTRREHIRNLIKLVEGRIKENG